MKYQVIRLCCTSGNCDACSHLGFGNQKLVIQLETLNKEQAERCRDNCIRYGFKGVKIIEKDSGK